jgi:hypothetical protein
MPERKKARQGNLIDQLLEKPISMKGFHLLSRDEIYGR